HGDEGVDRRVLGRGDAVDRIVKVGIAGADVDPTVVAAVAAEVRDAVQHRVRARADENALRGVVRDAGAVPVGFDVRVGAHAVDRAVAGVVRAGEEGDLSAAGSAGIYRGGGDADVVECDPVRTPRRVARRERQAGRRRGRITRRDVDRRGLPFHTRAG